MSSSPINNISSVSRDISQNAKSVQEDIGINKALEFSETVLGEKLAEVNPSDNNPKPIKGFTISDTFGISQEAKNMQKDIEINDTLKSSEAVLRKELAEVNPSDNNPKPIKGFTISDTLDISQEAKNMQKDIEINDTLKSSETVQKEELDNTHKEMGGRHISQQQREAIKAYS